jgi:hypothetical protein
LYRLPKQNSPSNIRMLEGLQPVFLTLVFPIPAKTV